MFPRPTKEMIPTPSQPSASENLMAAIVNPVFLRPLRPAPAPTPTNAGQQPKYQDLIDLEKKFSTLIAEIASGRQLVEESFNKNQDAAAKERENMSRELAEKNQAALAKERENINRELAEIRDERVAINELRAKLDKEQQQIKEERERITKERDQLILDRDFMAYLRARDVSYRNFKRKNEDEPEAAAKRPAIQDVDQ